MSERDETLLKNKVIGIIGLGDMGLLYARRFSEAGWKVIGCDREEQFDQLSRTYKDEKFSVKRNGHLVSREADHVIYSVEAENIDKIVSLYGSSTKYGAIVGGQTSCKTPKSLPLKSTCLQILASSRYILYMVQK